MKTKLKYLLVLLIFVAQLKVRAQKPEQMERVIDSLKKEADKAKHDTVKIKLWIDIGDKTNNNRIGFWDSLRSQAHNNKLYGKEIITLWKLGFCYRYTEEKAKTFEYFNEALKIAEGRGYKHSRCSTLCFLASQYILIADIKKGLDYGYKALKYAEEIKSKGLVAGAYNIIAAAYSKLGEHKKSLEMQLICLKLYKELNEKKKISNSLLGIGNYYSDIGDVKKAAEYYLESAKYINEFDQNSPHAVELYNSLGTANVVMKKYDSADYFYTKAYKIAESIDFKMGVASVKNNMAQNHFFRGNNKKAIPLAEEALELAKTINFKGQVQQTTLLLKEIYVKDKNYKRALETYSLYIATRDSTSSEDNRATSREKEYTYNLEKKESANKLLTQQNKIQSLEIKQNQYFMIGLGALLLMVLAIAWLFLRQNRFRNEQKSVQMEQKLLRTQMNPHFIFNALNTIQQFIITLDNDKAQLYLSKFSRLMRKLLESNVKETITLKEETEILEKYLEIESLRFNNVFAYEIKVQEGINPEQINIPHFLTQPFVENAIWHGLLPKDGDKKLTITFEKQDEKTLSCTIDDNGVGRQNKLRESPLEEKKSLAINFIKQRLELINRVRKTSYKLTLTDKKDADGNNDGLKVKIDVPIL